MHSMPTASTAPTAARKQRSPMRWLFSPTTASELPALRIYVHDSTEPCRDNLGLYGTGGDKERIDICTFEESVLQHELVHAWEHHSVNDATRDAFQAHMGLDNWNNHDEPHYSRGIEEAAYLLVWGMEDGPNLPDEQQPLRRRPRRLRAPHRNSFPPHLPLGRRGCNAPHSSSRRALR